MSYQSLVVCLDNSRHAQPLVEYSLVLAQHWQAQLCGLHLSYAPLAPYVPFTGVEPALVQIDKQILERQHQARDEFLAQAHAVGIEPGWQALRSSDMNQAIARARVADLIISSQRDPEDMATWLGEAFPGRFLLGVGRPVLFIPNDYDAPAHFERIVLAWNGSREATRALFDALPFMQQADQVSVMIVRGEKGQEPPWIQEADTHVASLLSRHGVKAQLIETVGALNASEWIIGRAQEPDIAAELIVCGAYGRNRISELILGGFTRDLLRDMPLPVLMSH